MLTYNAGMEPGTQADIFAAIAHPVRRQILDLLAEHERPVNELARYFDISRPAISQHLRILLDAGLVSETRSGRERRYHLTPERLAGVHDWLAHYEQFWNNHLQRLTDHLNREHS